MESAVRDYLRLRPGDRIRFFLHPDGGATILPKLPVTVLRGLVAPMDRPVTLEEMSEAIAAGAAEAAPPRS